MKGKDVLVGAGLGAALAFMADPERGARRRALVRDKFVWGSRKTVEGLNATARDLANRAKGTAAAVRGRFARDEVDDGLLVERVRAKLGHVCSHPRAIEVEAKNGEITLRGPILASEVNQVLSTIAAVRGVRSVNNALEAHESADNIPALQGDGRVSGPTLHLLQHNWAPAQRALVAAAGLAATGALVAYARR